jgi:hypothetical protein
MEKFKESSNGFHGGVSPNICQDGPHGGMSPNNDRNVPQGDVSPDVVESGLAEDQDPMFIHMPIATNT